MSKIPQQNLEISKIAKFGGEMLQNKENIALRSLQILYLFVITHEKSYHFRANQRIIL